MELIIFYIIMQLRDFSEDKILSTESENMDKSEDIQTEIIKEQVTKVIDSKINDITINLILM